MRAGDIQPPRGAVKKKRRLGCGPGSGRGKTCGRGHKGQKSRSGSKIRRGFEGGQMPIQMRLPKIRGTRSYRKVVYQVVNVGDLAKRGLCGEVTPEVLKQARCYVVVAGMEGALPSVGAGLVDRPVVAVPTSVGYGTAFGGLAALLGMLNSCAPGLSVVNIDNGFGAGYLAALIDHMD